MPLVFLNVSSFDIQNKSVRYNNSSEANMFYVNVTGFTETHLTDVLNVVKNSNIHFVCM